MAGYHQRMGNPRQPKTGIPSVIEMLQLLDEPTRKKILANVAQQDPKLAKQLENNLFGFEDIAGLSPRHTQALLLEVPEPKLLTALRNASDALKAHVFGNMSKRQATILQDELANSAPKRLSDVQAAQAEIIEIARRLEAEGKLLLRRSE